jgi:hypothetical protein
MYNIYHNIVILLCHSSCCTLIIFLHNRYNIIYHIIVFARSWVELELELELEVSLGPDHKNKNKKSAFFAARKLKKNDPYCEFHYTHMLKASGCLEVREWELGDLKDTK